MAPIVLPTPSFLLFPHNAANSTSYIKQQVSQSSVAFPTSSSSSAPTSFPTVLPHLLHEQLLAIIVTAPTMTYTSYTELNNNAPASQPASLPGSTPIGDSYTVETQAPQTNNAGRDIGIVIGLILGVLILGLIGWLYMLKARQGKRKRRKGKGKGKRRKHRKHRRHRKHRKTEEGAGENTGGEEPAAEGA